MAQDITAASAEREPAPSDGTPHSQEQDQHESFQTLNLAPNIVPRILNLYNCKATALDFEVYAPNATFEDPLMRAKGVKQIKSAFYSLPKLFGEAQIAQYQVEETETGPASGEIRIDNVQHYKLMGKQIQMDSLIKLQVENGLVVKHEDWWHKRPLWNKNTVKWPLIGRAVVLCRRGNMMITHTLMGFGRDPRPTDI